MEKNNNPPLCKLCKELRNEGSDYCTTHGEQIINEKNESDTCLKCGNPKIMYWCAECGNTEAEPVCRLCGKEINNIDLDYHNNCN